MQAVKYITSEALGVGVAKAPLGSFVLGCEFVCSPQEMSWGPLPETSLASHRERDLQRSFSFCSASATQPVCDTAGKVVSVTNTYIYGFNKVKLFFLLVVDLRVPRSLTCIGYQDTEVV